MDSNREHGRTFLDDRHDHGRCVNQALDQAAAICRDRGARLTEVRRRVLELIWGGHRPIGAYSVLDVLRQERRSAAPATVYRALDFLLEQGLIHRIESLNAFVGCCAPEYSHGGQFLICRSCGDTAELNDIGIDDAVRQCAEQTGFAVVRRTIEVEGLCPHCQQSEEAQGHE